MITKVRNDGRAALCAVIVVLGNLYLAGCGGHLVRAPQPAPDFSGYAISDPEQAELRLRILQTAQSLMGVPYRYGGTTPSGVDCSGLVFYSYGQAGLRVPRTTIEQYRLTQPVAAHQLLPGDLVFFRLNGRDISHVGLYQGDNLFIHAPMTGKEVSQENLRNRFWRERFVRGGRFM
ncbi:MAG: C40 family peptidase [Pseudomonadota bacterium]